MADDVHGADVAGQHHDAGEGLVRGAGGGRLAQSLDDFLDTALESLVLGGCGRG